jgi:hypothetical protein
MGKYLHTVFCPLRLSHMEPIYKEVFIVWLLCCRFPFIVKLNLNQIRTASGQFIFVNDMKTCKSMLTASSAKHLKSMGSEGNLEVPEVLV